MTLQLFGRPPLLLKVTGIIADVRTAKSKAKIYAIASFFGSMFEAVIPKECRPYFLPAYALRLLGTEDSGCLQALPLLDATSDRISHEIPQGA